MLMTNVLKVIRLIVEVFTALEADPSVINDEVQLAQLIVQKAHALMPTKAPRVVDDPNVLPF